MKEFSGAYFGLDITDKYALLSYYKSNMEEPETLSTVAGSEVFQIPMYLAKRRGVGQYYIGDDAKRQVLLNEAIGVEKLYSKALSRSMVMLETQEYPAFDLFIIFLRKLLTMPGMMFGAAALEKLVITVPVLDMEVMEFFTLIAGRLGLSSNQLLLIDYRESFYYYALNQRADVFLHDVVLFDLDENQLSAVRLERNDSTIPQVITMYPMSHGILMDDKDIRFDRVIDDTFGDRHVSAVFLTGDGFDGDWMKVSLAKLCKGRRVFAGKNLYSKGACYAGMIKDGYKDWPFVYMGDNELKVNVSLKVLDRNELKFISLLDAGDNWFDSYIECEVILDGTREVEFWIQRPESRAASVEVLELKDLPERENRTTRLRISANPVSDRQINITIRDLGFGEIVPSSNKVWEHELLISV
ncbi:MAG: hypothetical protein K5853_04535 [Lachnospiraceae bacterium]|nr:hypothetical protein [Lachnospiraceae bacterium]